MHVRTWVLAGVTGLAVAAAGWFWHGQESAQAELAALRAELATR